MKKGEPGRVEVSYFRGEDHIHGCTRGELFLRLIKFQRVEKVDNIVGVCFSMVGTEDGDSELANFSSSLVGKFHLSCYENP